MYMMTLLSGHAWSKILTITGCKIEIGSSLLESHDAFYTYVHAIFPVMQVLTIVCRPVI